MQNRIEIVDKLKLNPRLANSLSASVFYLSSSLYFGWSGPMKTKVHNVGRSEVSLALYLYLYLYLFCLCILVGQVQWKQKYAIWAGQPCTSFVFVFVFVSVFWFFTGRVQWKQKYAIWAGLRSVMHESPMHKGRVTNCTLHGSNVIKFASKHLLISFICNSLF